MLFAFLGVFAEARPIYSERYLLKDIRIGQQTMLQESGQVFSGVLLYTPSMKLSRRTRLGVDLGVSATRFGSNPLFPVLEYGLHGYYFFLSWLAFDASVGLENWLSNGGHLPYAGAGFTFRLDNKVLRFFQQFFANVAYVNLTPRPIYQIRIGVGFVL